MNCEFWSRYQNGPRQELVDRAKPLTETGVVVGNEFRNKLDRRVLYVEREDGGPWNFAILTNIAKDGKRMRILYPNLDPAIEPDKWLTDRLTTSAHIADMRVVGKTDRGRDEAD